MKKIVGVIKHSNLEGSCWTVETDSGERYVLDGLAAEYQKDGLRVELEGEEEAAFSIFMMGKTFHVQNVRCL